MEASLVIDYTEVAPVATPSTISMANNFVLNTATFLNRFLRLGKGSFRVYLSVLAIQFCSATTKLAQKVLSKSSQFCFIKACSPRTFSARFSFLCESKLRTVSSNIQQLEITLALLEAKLQSVEGAGTTTPTASTTTTTTTTTTTEATGAPTPTGGPPPPPGGPVAGNTSEPEAAPAPPPAPSLTWRKDPRYSKFFSLLDMGVPLGQIQRDMMLKGMNPKILENPDGASDYVEAAPKKRNSYDTESEEEEDDWD